MASRRGFWWGRIETPEHAVKITRTAGLGFGAFAALLLLFQLEEPDAARAAAVLLIGAPALALYMARSVWAARGLALLFGLLGALLLAMPVFWLIEREPIAYVLLFGAMALPFALGFLAALRAHSAALFLKRRPAAAPGLLID